MTVPETHHPPPPGWGVRPLRPGPAVTLADLARTSGATSPGSLPWTPTRQRHLPVRGSPAEPGAGGGQAPPGFDGGRRRPASVADGAPPIASRDRVSIECWGAAATSRLVLREDAASRLCYHPLFSAGERRAVTLPDLRQARCRGRRPDRLSWVRTAIGPGPLPDTAPCRSNRCSAVSG